MSDELSFEARMLFREARHGLAPEHGDLARARARVRAAIAGGAVVASVASIARPAAAATSKATIIAASVAIAGAGAGIGWWATHRTHEPTPAIVAPEPAPRAPARATRVIDDAPHTTIVPSITVTPLPAPVATAPRHKSSPRAEEPVVAPPPAPPPPDVSVVDTPAVDPPAIDPLARELARVRDADAALRAGDAAGALAIVRASRDEDPDGQLAAELAAIEIDALCALDRTGDAATAAAAFHRRWPRSTLGARVRASCADPGGNP
ncbi:MAG TPA: hypothetical protein VL463_10035 [Kofleriaceae bacterium]|nr:hypothetical protein [Kofleriaceae bacterium]